MKGGGGPPRTDASRLTGIVAAAVLAGKVSLIAALLAHRLVEAHMR
ncbi:MAG: hypothetical protein RMJ28_06500 [Nitrososphaerota archaeon]|nr:hypothetical protein [Candidatus Calditenuaceae archaeon]MDW8073865.1 hypothetical protein [Nitrososphaerota archaeon]